MHPRERNLQSSAVKSMLRAVLAAGTLGIGTAYAQTPTPLIPAPRCSGPVTIDGRLDEPAWRTAQSLGPFTGLVRGAPVQPQPTVLVAWDDHALYIGARLPKPENTVLKTTVTKHDGPVWNDDAFEVFLDPGHTRTRYYQFIVNAGGVGWDSIAKDSSWDGSWKSAVSAPFDANAWSVEIAVPFTTVEGPPAPGQTWGFNVAWDRQTPMHRVASWAAVEGTLHQPDRFGEIQFAPSAPLVTVTDSRVFPSRGEMVLSLSLVEILKPVKVEWWFGRAGALEKQESVSIPTNPKREIRFRSALPLKNGFPAKSGDFVGSAVVRMDGRDVFRSVLRMQVPPLLDVTVRKYLLRARRLEIDVSGGLMTKRPGPMRIEFHLIPSKTERKQPVASAHGALDAKGRASLALVVRDVPPGRYDLRARLVAPDGNPVFEKIIETIDIPRRPEWLGNHEGFTDRVLPPWTPIEVEDSAIHVALREYRWGALPFPEGITARGKSVLAAPIRLVAVVNGKTQTWTGDGPVFSIKTPARVEFRTRAESADAIVTGNLWCEYDGCLRCDWRLNLKRPEDRLDRLVLEIPYKSEHARYLYHFPGRWRSHFNAGALPPDGAVLGFRPFVWLGDEWRGFAWFCPSDESFRPADPQRVTEIIRRDGVVLLRIHLLDKALPPGQGFHTTFGFEATPVRSNPEDVWDYRIVHTGNYGLEKRTWTPPLSITWPAQGNLDVRQGILEAWVRPHFDPNVAVAPKDPGRGRYNRNFFQFSFGGYVVGYYWNIDDRDMRFYVRSPDGKFPIILGARCEWKKGEWHHIALSWGKEIRLYHDGRFVARRTFSGLLPARPENLKGGVLRLGGGRCDMDVDDFSISDIQREPKGMNGPLTPDAHTLLLEPFDALHIQTRAVSTVPTIARGGPGTATRAVALIDGRFGKAAALAYHGPLISVLDRYRELGVKTICFHEHWSRIQNYFAPADPDGLRRLVKACHDRGIRILVYYGYELSNIAPEWKTYRDEVLVYPRAGGYHRLPEQRCYICCYHSAWQDYLAWAIARTIDEFDVDGVYLDGTANPFGCANIAHGCGWIDENGRRHKTYPFFAVRQMMKRIYTIVKTRKPHGLVNVHQSTCMTIPSVGWATSYWDGEQFGSIPRSPDHAPLEVLPLDAFRTEFMGHNWGVPAELLCYGRPYTYPEALAIALVHDVLVRPNDIESAASIWKAAAHFGRKQAKWLPYWENREWVQTAPDAVKCSLYSKDGQGVLAVVSNLSSKSVKAEVRLRLDRLGLPRRLRVTDALQGTTIPCIDGRIATTLEPLEFRIIRFDPGSPQ